MSKSSQINNETHYKRSPSSEFLLILYYKLSCKLRGIWSWEYDIWSPNNNSEAIPEEVT